MPLSSTQLDALLAISTHVDYFRTPAGQVCARLPEANGRRAVVTLLSRDFKDWLINQTSTLLGNIPSFASIAHVFRSIEARAFGSPLPQAQAPLRAVSNKSTIEIDTASGSSIIITAAGWSTSPNTGALFLTVPGQKPLPQPIATNRPLANLLAESTGLALNTAATLAEWLTSAATPGTANPVLNLTGTGANNLAARLREIIDPQHSPFNQLPRSSSQILRLALNNRILIFQNVERLSENTAGLLQALATSGAPVSITERLGRIPITLTAHAPVIVTSSLPLKYLRDHRLTIEVPDSSQICNLAEWLGALLNAISQSLPANLSPKCNPVIAFLEMLGRPIGHHNRLPINSGQPPPYHPTINAFSGAA